MKEENLQNIPSIPPHRYPLGIKLFAIILIATFVYSIFLLPKYFSASREFRSGMNFYDSQQYSKAIQHFEEALSKVPTSKAARIAIAKAYFSNNGENDDATGIEYLQDITLSEDDWSDITSVMPKEY